MNQLRSTVSGLTSGGRRRQLSIVKLKVQSRNYQSDRGVYGYKKKAEKPAAGNELETIKQLPNHWRKRSRVSPRESLKYLG